MGLLDGFLGGILNSGAESGTSSQEIPEWLRDPIIRLIERAEGTSNEAYQGYDSPRVAPFSPDQQTAFDYARALPGSPEFQNFYNPYIGGVHDEISRRGIETLTEDILPQVSTTFTGAGQYGSSRHADFNQRAIRNTEREILGAMAPIEAQGFQDALGNQRQYASDLLGTGAAQQGLGQQSADVAYGDFLEQRNWPYSQQQYMSGILSGQPYDIYGTSQPATPGTAQQLAGLGIAGIGLYNLM